MKKKFKIIDASTGEKLKLKEGEMLVMNNLRETLIQDSMDKLIFKENNLILEAIYAHTGNWYESAASLLFIADRLHTEIRSEVKHIFLDGVEILEIHPLQFDTEGMILATKFNYKIHPKVI